MDNLDKEIAVDHFVKDLEYNYSNIKLLIKFMAIDDPKHEKQLNHALHVLNKKIKEIKKSKSSDSELKKHIKIKKVCSKYGDK